jgi:hypothetical protein
MCGCSIGLMPGEVSAALKSSANNPVRRRLHQDRRWKVIGSALGRVDMEHTGANLLYHEHGDMVGRLITRNRLGTGRMRSLTDPVICILVCAGQE